MKDTFNSAYETFYYESFEFNHRKKRLTMCFSFDKKEYFSEEIKFDFKFIHGYSEVALDNALRSLFILSGVYYYSLFLAPKIVIEPFTLTKAQASFFDSVFLHGLGELLFENSVSPSVIAHFPFGAQADSILAPKTTTIHNPLVLQGGGKDSLVTIALLKKANADFDLLRCNPTKWSKKQAKITGKKQVSVYSYEFKTHPKITPTEPIWGHVPFSAILAFRAVTVAILTGRKYVIASNESSASEGNTRFEGMDINHQYSKSFAFETRMQEYVELFISPSITYFSLLRPLSELKITEIFSSLAWPEYKNVFGSCNNSDEHPKQKKPYWCGACPKCICVYALLITFIPKPEVEEQLFGGKDLLVDEKLNDIWFALLGIQGLKPFECVATADEIRSALHIASKSNKISLPEKFKITSDSGVWREKSQSSIPRDFQHILDAV